MKTAIYDLSGKKVRDLELPKQFETDFRPDIIKRAVLAVQANNRQPYGADLRAGMKYSSPVSKRRRHYRGSYGKGISRSPRKVMTKRGMQLYWIGATAPFTVGGRRAHPPKGYKDWTQKVNKKENRFALCSALAAATIKDVVLKRGHRIENVPIVMINEFENLDKTKDVRKVLEAVGLREELERCEGKKVRAGKGKSRGRRYENKVGPLIIVSEKCKLQMSAKNIAGVDIANVRYLNAEMLAPGAMPGRLIIFTDKAIKTLADEKLYLADREKTQPIKKAEEPKKVQIEKPKKVENKTEKKLAVKKPAKKGIKK